MPSKSSRNKTIDTSLEDGANYLERCVRLTTGQTSLDGLMDRTILGDMFSVCPLLPPRSVDLIVADPPYNLTKSFNGTTFSKRRTADYEAYTRRWLELVKPLLKATGSIYVCCDWETSLIVGRVLGEFFHIKSRITWQREKGRGASANWKNGMEDIWFATNSHRYTFHLDAVKTRRRVVAPYREEGRPKDWEETEEGNFRDTCPSNFWDDITIPFWSMAENTAHPTQKSEKLIAKILLASSSEGDIVFDPFLGSGTTSVVAKKLNRHYLGVEIEPQYCLWAEQRLAMADEDRDIQGYVDGVFWERNVAPARGKDRQERQRGAEHSLQPASPKGEEGMGHTSEVGQMFHQEVIGRLVRFIQERDGVGDKAVLSAQVQEEFDLTKARSVFYGECFAIRFCKVGHKGFSNTVLSLSALRQYDHLPFLVCLVMPDRNELMLANTTFLKKISQTSQALRVDNIRGSFNGSDILREFEGERNSPENFAFLYSAHMNYTFEENLLRLVEATTQIAPIGKRFQPTPEQRRCIYDSVRRAREFLQGEEYQRLNKDLDDRVRRVQPEIALAAAIPNGNLRGRLIEHLITLDGDVPRELSDALRNHTPLPDIYTADGLGDYVRDLGRFSTATDIKTKTMSLSSSPKGFNIDKMLSFLAEENSVYLLYLVAIGQDGSIQTRLCSMYNRQLLSDTRIIKHWAGRNSRGVTQYSGRSLEQIVEDFDGELREEEALAFLDRCLED